MKKTLVFMLALVALGTTASCKEKSTETAAPAKPAMQQAAPAQAADGISGTVSETVDSGGYTYVQVDTGSEKIWAAAPQFPVKTGDAVIVPQGLPMSNYHSKTLDRTFDLVYFVGSVMVAGAEAPAEETKMPEGHPPIAGQAPAAAPTQSVDLAGIEKAEGGKTVAEIFSGKADLSGKEVVVRGKVVKFSANIMGKNWLHLQDGTGENGTNDLTVTTAADAKVGDTVVVTGVVSTDKDFGAGYKYDVILDDATVKVE